MRKVTSCGEVIVKDLVWSNTLSVEVDEIDEDHRRLVDLFNILNHAVADGESADYQEAVLEELISCTVWHFKHEERLMLKYAYEEFAAHKTEHQDLIESAKALQQQFLQADKRIANKDIEFLEHWLTEHILVADMRLGAYLIEVM
ncbi:MAG: bacteriohemerythrin [Candidatus Thiodiazotropha sp. (ex Lucinoma borealis)]|nr:bacteriohemerythrin [Candidatus Thiodiazotropha sp. (ex Lucinoma borealis)]MCU7842102.1 bacteriohemerythrin [Candidatus Thiodiazotropha sp. (ex Troendleina suluensis)]MCU7855759.1 bacteriohemerythrin [Candidatus Thiodiazotropha sp. (ex Lucinoma borealis)]MCU7864436.1 bacteriohemerythrin [Candidatus Thiodiazotropha sp. (ex Lucinoma borealis)]MCU7869370.1 bacteriohemerythrin [Candidatus Thiodiazotropha sp. (ex Lucinoma borealis)]